MPDVCGSSVDLVNPAIAGSKAISLATIYIEVGNQSKPHYHKVTEEIYYFLEGFGRVIIDNEVFNVSKGSAVYIPLLKVHQVINDCSTRLKFLSADTPPFDTSDIYFS